MPAAFPPELKEKVKMVAFQVGFREAARQCEVDEKTVLKWAEREGWTKQKQQVIAAKALKIEKQGLSSVVVKSSAEIMASYNGDTKLYSAKVCHDTAKALSEKDVDELILLAPVNKMNVDSASKVFGWNDQQVTTNIAIQINAAQVPDC